MPVKNLSPNMEDYLESIFYLQNSEGIARVRDIAKRMDVKMPSVSDALKILQQKKLLTHVPYGHVELTAGGENLAREMLKRHHQLSYFLREVLGVNAQTAEQDACRIEHIVSPQTMERLLALIHTVEECGEQDCFLRAKTKKMQTSQAAAKQAESKPELTTLMKGQTAVISEVSPHKTLRRRLLDKGLTAGEQVEMLTDFTSGHQAQVRVKGYRVSIGEKEAALVKVGAASAK